MGSRVPAAGEAGMSAPDGPSPPSEAEITVRAGNWPLPHLRTANAPRFKQPAERFEEVWPTAVNVASHRHDIPAALGRPGSQRHQATRCGNTHHPGTRPSQGPIMRAECPATRDTDGTEPALARRADRRQCAPSRSPGPMTLCAQARPSVRSQIADSAQPTAAPTARGAACRSAKRLLCC